MHSTTGVRRSGVLRFLGALAPLTILALLARPAALHAAPPAIVLTTNDIAASPSTPFNGTLAQMTDAASVTAFTKPSVTIDWGDGAAGVSATVTGTGATPAGLHGFSVSGSHTYSSGGTFTVTLDALDHDGNAAHATLSAVVAQPALQVTLTPPGSFTEGTAWSGTIATVTDPSCSSGSVTYTYTVDWGDGSTPSTGTTTGACSASTAIPGTHTYAHAGGQHVYVTVSAPGAAAGSATQPVTVGDAALVNLQSIAVNAVENAPLTGPLLTFADADPNATSSLYSVTIDWGDQTPLDSSGAVAALNGAFQVSGTHTYLEEGAYRATVTVRDAGGSQANATAAATVADAPLAVTGATLAGTTNTVAQGVAATFTDADANGTVSDYTTFIDWGDGTGPDTSSTVQSVPGGGFQVSGAHAYGHAGAYTTTITVADASASAQAHGSVVVGGGMVAVTAGALSGAEGSSSSGPGGVVAAFSEAGCAAGTTFTASIDWGDATATTSGSVAGGCPSGGTVTGAHAYATAGAYIVKVHLASSDGSSGDGTGSASIADAPIVLHAASISATAGSAFSGPVATLTDPAQPLSRYVVTILWGDGTPSSSGSVAAANGTLVVSGSHTFSRRGTYAVQVQVSDAGDAQPASATATATVSPAALALTVAGITATQGVAYNGSVGALTDPDPPTAPVPAYSATIDWGDGSTATPATLSLAAGAYTLSGTHTYARGGTFTLAANASDGAGRQISAHGTATVAAGRLSGTALPFSVQAGTAYTGTLATFSDGSCAGGAPAYSARIDWGDGASSVGNVGGSCAAGFAVTSSHTYAAQGSYTFTATVDAGSGRTLRLQAAATVQPASPVQTGGGQPGGGQTGGGGGGSTAVGNAFGPGAHDPMRTNSTTSPIIAVIPAGTPSSGTNGGPAVQQSGPLLRGVAPLGGNRYQVQLTSAAGTPVSAILALVHGAGGVLALWRQAPNGTWQACYFANGTAPLDVTTTTGGLETYVLTLAPGATIG